MAKKKNGSRDHYVSRLYLRGWATNEEGKPVWCYTKTPHTGEIQDKTVSTKSIMWEQDLYAFESPSNRQRHPRGVEPILNREIEDKAAPVLEKLRVDEPISIDERKMFANYVYTQTWRLPSRISRHQDVSQHVAAELIARYRSEPGSDPQFMDQVEALFTPAEARDLAMGDLVRNSEARETAIGALVAMEWLRFRIKQPGLLTSDCPVFGLPSTGIILMPICPYRLMMFVPPEVPANELKQQLDDSVHIVCAIANALAIKCASHFVVSNVSLQRLNEFWGPSHDFRRILEESRLRPWSS